MAHYTLIARINAGNGRFPFVNVQFTKTHRPIPIAGATYYLRRSGGARTPIRIGKDRLWEEVLCRERNTFKATR